METVKELELTFIKQAMEYDIESLKNLIENTQTKIESAGEFDSELMNEYLKGKITAYQLAIDLMESTLKLANIYHGK